MKLIALLVAVIASGVAQAQVNKKPTPLLTCELYEKSVVSRKSKSLTESMQTWAIMDDRIMFAFLYDGLQYLVEAEKESINVAVGTLGGLRVTIRSAVVAGDLWTPWELPDPIQSETEMNILAHSSGFHQTILAKDGLKRVSLQCGTRR